NENDPQIRLRRSLADDPGGNLWVPAKARIPGWIARGKRRIRPLGFQQGVWRGPGTEGAAHRSPHRRFTCAFYAFKRLVGRGGIVLRKRGSCNRRLSRKSH